MSHKEEIEQTIRDIQVDLDWWIKHAMRVKRKREYLAVYTAIFQMPGLFWDFYHLHYGHAAISLGLALGMPCLSWWILSKPLKFARERKRKLAWLKLRGQHLLEKWRGYPN